MSEENNDNNENAQSGDQVDNLKAEMNRKLSNTDQQMAELKKLNEAMLQQVSVLAQSTQTQRQQQDSQAETSSIKDLWFDDPQKAMEMIEQRTEKKLLSKVSAMNQAQQKQSAVISGLVSDYPELSDSNHELTRKTVEIYERMPEDDKTSPLAYKVAARDAAAELGIAPRSKRSASSASSDSFTFGGGGSRTMDRDVRTTEELPEGVKTFAKIMGVDLSKKDVAERVKATHNNLKRKGEKFS